MNIRAFATSILVLLAVGLAGATPSPGMPTRTRSATEPISEEVAFQNEPAGVRLAGTLTRPAAQGRHSAVLLITGSGPQDRDETILSHKPFLAIADHLSRRGVVVLRYDDRGVGGSTGDFGSATTEDFAADARAGVEFLRQRKDVDPRRIGLVGHSEGALVAALLAAGSRDIAFVATMGGPGMPGEELLALQGERILRASGVPDSAVIANREIQRAMFAVVKSEPDSSIGAGRIRTEITASVERMAEGDRTALRLTPGMVEAIVRQVQVGYRWMRFFLTFDPRESLRRVTCPVLVLAGAKDLQVPSAENVAAIEGALRAGGNTAVTVACLPDHNHLFQRCATGLPTEYGSIDHPISALALATLSDWIVSVTAH